MLKKQTVNEDKIQKSKVQAEQSKPQSKDRKMSRGEILKKVFGHLGKYRIFVVFSVLLAAVSVALTLYIPKLIGYAVDEIIGKGAVNFAGIFRILFQIGICTGITALAQWLMNVCNNKMTYQVVQDVRNEAFRKIQILPLKYIDNHPSGEIVSSVIADVDQFADGLLMGFTQLFTGAATIIGTLGFMLSVDVNITFVVVLITPISFFVANFIARKTFAQSPARRVNPRDLIPGILSAPAAGIPGFFRLIFAPARRFSLYPSCMRTRFFAIKVTKEYGRPGRF